MTAVNLAAYDSPASVRAYGQRRGLFAVEDALVTAYFPPAPARILDLGCGAGRTTVVLHRRGYRVTGIDLSDALLAEARRLAPELDVRRMDATELAFEDGTMDAVLFSYNGIDCLHPVSARQRCLAEVRRVLRAGGVFVLSTHNAMGAIFSGGYFYPRGYLNAARWLWQQRGNPYWREWYWRYEDVAGPQYLYSAPPSRTIQQAEAAGLELVEVRGATGERRRGRIARHEQHVYFVLRRPSRA